MSVDECYTFKQYKYTDGIFSKHIDATYIIYLSGSTRMTSIMSQLEQYHPTDNVYILINKPFKYCKKNLIRDRIAYDIIDSNMHIFNHAKQNDYENILVLEDDFIFSPEIKNTTHIDNINSFLNKHTNTDFIYQLGCAPIILIPYNSYTYIAFISWGAHAHIYSRKSYMRHLNEYDNKMKSYTELGGLDTYATINNIRYWNVFTYYKPLCYQTYPNTDSRLESSSSASLMLISTLGIDKEPEPGTSILYFISKILFPLLLILLFYIVKFIISYVKSFKSISKSIKYFHTIKNK
jgi:hypothetical protein